MKKVSSPSFESVLSKKWKDFPTGRRKEVSPFFFALSVCFSFWERNGRMPKTKEELVDLSMEFDCEPSKYVSQDFLQVVAKNTESELSAVCALVGGILAQEIIKVISAKDEPIKNFFIYDGFSTTGKAELIEI